MERTTLENQDICQPLWLIDFLVGYFPEMLYNSSNEVYTEVEELDMEDLFYGTVLMELLRHGDAVLVDRALDFIRSIDHVIRMDLPAEHLCSVKNLVSFSREIYFTGHQNL